MNKKGSRVCDSARGFPLVMRHVQHRRKRHRVVIEAKHLLAGRAAAAHAVIGPVLRTGAQRISGRRRFPWRTWRRLCSS